MDVQYGEKREMIMCFWISDIVVSLLLRLLVEALTLMGVKITIKNENQAIKQERVKK